MSLTPAGLTQCRGGATWGIGRNGLPSSLAAQQKLVSDEQLLQAVEAWACDRAEPLEEVLHRLGSASDEERGILKNLAAQHLEENDGETTWATLSPNVQLRHRIEQLLSPELEATVVALADAGDAAASSSPAPRVDGERFPVLGAAGRDDSGARASCC